MADSNAGNMSSDKNPDENDSIEASKPSLTKVTHKLKAEALRRYKLTEEEPGSAGDSNGDHKEDSADKLTSATTQQFEPSEIGGKVSAENKPLTAMEDAVNIQKEDTTIIDAVNHNRNEKERETRGDESEKSNDNIDIVDKHFDLTSADDNLVGSQNSKQEMTVPEQEIKDSMDSERSNVGQSDTLGTTPTNIARSEQGQVSEHDKQSLATDSNTVNNTIIEQDVQSEWLSAGIATKTQPQKLKEHNEQPLSAADSIPNNKDEQAETSDNITSNQQQHDGREAEHFSDTLAADNSMMNQQHISREGEHSSDTLTADSTGITRNQEEVSEEAEHSSDTLATDSTISNQQQHVSGAVEHSSDNLAVDSNTTNQQQHVGREAADSSHTLAADSITNNHGEQPGTVVSESHASDQPLNVIEQNEQPSIVLAADNIRNSEQQYQIKQVVQPSAIDKIASNQQQQHISEDKQFPSTDDINTESEDKLLGQQPDSLADGLTSGHQKVFNKQDKYYGDDKEEEKKQDDGAIDVLNRDKPLEVVDTQAPTSEENSNMISPSKSNDESSASKDGEPDNDEKAKGNEESTKDDHLQSDVSEENVDDNYVLEDGFYYEGETSLFNPIFTEGVPRELLALHHSFGYECTKRENLHILDTNTVVFASGNLVHLLNLVSMEHTYIGGTNSGGIGAITVHPSRQYFAVAEKGDKPTINIYEYPSLKLFRVLREGTLEAYAHLNFSPTGTKLASLGSSPDFMLTIWDWRNEKVILRSKAFSQDVYKVVFSPENEGHLCTSGTGHIRFWSMANTFTGLKLQGELGRFGTTELTDIEGFVELPDGKVLSGSEWGNMLLWDGGLIKVEICKKGNKLCHNGMIEQFFMDEGELMTIGADGYIKVWDFEGIDNADITDEQNRMFAMEPMYEIKVGTDVKLKSMVKSVNLNTPTIWYGQDASGAVWKLDLSFTHTSHAPELLFSYHAGSITCVEASPISHLVVTCGLDCTVRLYDYIEKLPLCMAKYSSPATCLLWMPKNVDPKCTSILCGFSDGVVRYLSVARDKASLSRNKRNKSNLEFQLTQVFKPHTSSITSLVLDNSGKMLATGSEDCTVFFFAVQDTCKPIGFIETASPVVSISWLDNSADPGRLLVFCKDGAVLDVEVPKATDTDKTFRLPLQDLVKREYMFTRVKDKLLKAEEDERKARIKEEKRKRKEEERKRRRARGIEEEEEEEEEEEDEDEEETKDMEPVEHGPCVLIRGFPSASLETFWMLMDGWDAGYIYECEFPKKSSEEIAQEPINAIKLLGCGDCPIRSYTYSNSGEFVIFGMENGVVRIHPVHGRNVLDSLTTSWSAHIHDSHYGAITAIRTSFDDKYVFTVGADGNFFVYDFMNNAILKESKPLSQIPKLQTVIGEDGQEVPKTIDDIDDPNYYSIELEKQKAEHDRMVKIAEEKKQSVRRKIAKLRRSFKALLSQNDSLPDYLRIRAQELEIDPEIRKQQEAKTIEKIDLVRKELEWESEKHSIGLKKLQDRFKSMLECDRIVLHACSSSHKVASFRSSKLSDLYESLKESLSKEKGIMTAKDQKKQSIAGGKGLLPGKRRSTQVELRKKSHQPTSGGEVGGKVAKELEKAEQRRQKKELREAEWDDLCKSKPDENYQDPSDVSAIKEARDNMGDYKLKTAEDYVVPEGQRVNAEIKLQQLLRLLDQIHYHKLHFNEKLLALRDTKISIIKEIKESVVALKNVQEKLEPGDRKPVPKVPEMKPEEMPERKLSYDKEILYNFKKELQIKKDKVEKEGGGGGFGGFGTSESKPPQATAGGRDRSFSNVSVLSGGRPKSHQSMKLTDQTAPEAIMENVDESLSALEIELKRREQIKMKFQQDRLLKRIEHLLTNFDGELKTLRHDKSQFEVTLKNADLRHVTLFEELMLLKEFEKRENTFANRVKIKEDEKQHMEEKVDSCQTKLDIKKEEIDKYMEQEKSLYSTFTSMIGENNKFEGFLTKVFKKKIKRAKKKDESQDGSEEESDDEDSDEELSSSEESNSDEEALDDSVCPPGCDQALFDQVCQLRENRLDIEEFLAEEKKALDSLKKENEALNKRSKVIDSALLTAESELEAFQREKQQKLNELDVVVTVKLHQIQYIVNNSMPQDLFSCLVFVNSDQNRLQTRIKELEVEKAEQKRLFREHRQMHVQLKRDKKSKEAEIFELEEKVKDMQMLKFGRLVDFDRLENISVNRNAEELKERLRQQEFQNANEIAKWEKRIQSFREKLTLRTRENTGRLNTSTLLLHERQELEQKLDSKQKSLGAQYSGNRKADIKERHRLVQLVQLQAQEIDALKDEITLLSRKGGHILPPTQPPLPAASQAAIPNI